MEQEFRVLSGMIARATALITPEYFQLPVADADAVYRERVYCYELYHRLRSLWGDFGFSLGGEVDKIGHPHFRGGPYSGSKPDFLIHRPGDMERNLVCIEVKPYGRSVVAFRDDLAKLTWFCRHAHYHAGIFLVYGLGGNEAPLCEQLRRASLNNDAIDLTRLTLLAHSAPGESAITLNL